MAREEIAVLSQQLVAAANVGDVTTVASLYTEDAKLLLPNAETVVGRDAIERFYTMLRDQFGLRDMAAEITELGSEGDLAYEVGRYSLTLQPEGGEAIRDIGKYVFVWKRQEGTWRIAVDAPNSDLPPPGT